jgi:hypothetical protein
MENANKKNLAIVRQLHQAMTIIFDMPMPPSPVSAARAAGGFTTAMVC